MNKERTNIQISLDKELHKKIKMICLNLGTTLQKYLEDILKNNVN